MIRDLDRLRTSLRTSSFAFINRRTATRLGKVFDLDFYHRAAFVPERNPQARRHPADSLESSQQEMRSNLPGNFPTIGIFAAASFFARGT